MHLMNCMSFFFETRHEKQEELQAHKNEEEMDKRENDACMRWGAKNHLDIK